MIDASSRFRDEERPLSIFAKGKPTPIMGPDRKRAYVGGVFYAGPESRESDPEVYKYNELITSLLGRWEMIFVKMLKEGLGNKATGENKELRRKWKKEIMELLEESVKLLKGKDIDPGKVVFTPLPSRRKKKGTSIGKDVNTFKVYYGRLTEGKGDINLYYLDIDVAGRLENLLDGLRSEEISPFDYTEELGRLRREVNIRLVEKLLECEDLESEVREFFESLKELGERAVEGDDILAQLFFDRLFKIEIDFRVGLAGEEEEGEESPWLTHKPLITKLGYGDTYLTYEEVLFKIGKEAVRREELSDKSKEDLIREVEEEAEAFGILEWLKKVYRDKKGESPFLKKLRRELTRILRGEVPGVKKVSFVRDGKAVYSVKKEIYADTYGQFVLYESSLVDKARKFVKALRRKEGMKSKYLNPEMMEKEVLGYVEIEFLFPFWKDLKNHDSYTFTGDLAYKALVFLLQVAGFFKAIRSLGIEKNTTYMVFALLDVKDEEDRYPIWDLVRAFVDHALAYPFQTFGRKAIDKIVGGEKDAIFFKKNALISALRADRRVVLRFNSLKIRKPVVYSMLVEDRCVELIGVGRHYLYSLYRFAFKDDSFTIERDDRKFFVFADGFSGDVKELEKFLMETSNLIVISQDTKSPLLNYRNESFFPVLYRSIKTPLLLKGTTEDKNAYVIFEKEFKKGLRYMGWLSGGQEDTFRDYTLFAIRAPLVVPPTMKDEPYMSTELSLFFVGNLKGDNPEVEEGVLLSLLGWLVWGSESFSFLYAKPKFMPLKLPKAVVRRMNRDYTVPLGTSVLELAYIMKKAEEKTQRR